jgi:DNA (cytosine-5)-methyltransferase 1
VAYSQRIGCGREIHGIKDDRPETERSASGAGRSSISCGEGALAHANGERKSQSQGVQSEEWGRIGNGCVEAHIPDATGIGREPRRAEPAGQQRTARTLGHRGTIPHASCAGCQELDLATLATREGQRTGRAPAEWGEAWWADEPGLGRVAHGTPHRVDRLRCIGNGQVPHCTYFIGRLIQEHHRTTFSK